MPIEEFLRSTTLLVVLLNPFLLAVYLIDLIRSLDRGTFARVLIRAALIALTVFSIVAVVGERLFVDVLQVRYAAFLIFGGVVFLLVGVRMVFDGPAALRQVRGAPQHVVGGIAMPFLIGPGTVNASLLAGSRLDLAWALLSIVAGLSVTVAGVYVAKVFHDWVQHRREALVERYLEVVGRISSLLIGSIAVDMILHGVELWQAD